MAMQTEFIESLLIVSIITLGIGHWSSVRLFLTLLARRHVGVQLQLFSYNSL